MRSIKAPQVFESCVEIHLIMRTFDAVDLAENADTKVY